MLSGRSDLFRLLGDEDRLRLLALCAEEELTVGELAQLLGESQPQVTKKTQPLREVGLLAARRDGTRTLLKTDVESDRNDAVIAAALEEGRTLCSKDGSLAKVPRVIAAREELSRRLFETPAQDTPAPAADNRSPITVEADTLEVIQEGGRVKATGNVEVEWDTTKLRAAEIYGERFARPSGRVAATFEVLFLHGWAPHASQPKPLKPGSAARRLADALDSVEQSAGEKAERN